MWDHWNRKNSIWVTSIEQVTRIVSRSRIYLSSWGCNSRMFSISPKTIVLSSFYLFTHSVTVYCSNRLYTASNGLSGRSSMVQPQFPLEHQMWECLSLPPRVSKQCHWNICWNMRRLLSIRHGNGKKSTALEEQSILICPKKPLREIFVNGEEFRGFFFPYHPQQKDNSELFFPSFHFTTQVEVFESYRWISIG